MIISDKLKLIFIHVHRTAGTSLSNILRQSLAVNSECYSQHTNAKILANNFFENYSDYYIFGFTRNPWERILSWYSLIHLNNKKSLEEERKRLEKFIEFDLALDSTKNFFHYNSLDYFATAKGELIMDKIYRYENLDSEIRSILNQFDLPETEIPVINVGDRKNYKDYYTNKSRDLIAQKCKKDIDYFNYTF